MTQCCGKQNTKQRKCVFCFVFSLFLDFWFRARLLYSPFYTVSRCGARIRAGDGEPAGVPEEPAAVPADAADHPAEPDAPAGSAAATGPRQPATPAGGRSLAASRPIECCGDNWEIVTFVGTS